MQVLPEKSERRRCKIKLTRGSMLLATVLVVLVIVAGTALLTLFFKHHWSSTDKEEQSSADHSLRSISAQYRYAAASSDAPICSQIATDILGRHGGSAVDAAIAGIICVGVVKPQSCGIGGGSIATIYDTPRNGTEKILVNILFREAAPSAAHRDMFVEDPKTSVTGGLAVAVPGEVKGLYAAWEMFGRVPWKELYAPSIRLCEKGVPVVPSLAYAISYYSDLILNDTQLRSIFVNKDGTVKQEGDIMKRPLLAQTLRRIAEDPHTFYDGSLARDVASDLQERGGIITTQDLADYTAKIKTPLNITVRRKNGNFILFSPPPPFSGAIDLFIVNVLKGYNWSNETMSTIEGRVLTYHRIAEVFKFAYARRSQLGDEDFVNVSKLVANLTDDNYADDIRALINDTWTQELPYYGVSFEERDLAGTAHMNVLAQDGGSVAITSTINTYFGSKVVGSRTGIIFNNEMDDFSTPGTINVYGVPASPSNFIVPGKMPMSSMCPTLVLDGEGHVRLATGAAGGTRITTHTAFVTIQHLMFGKDITDATDAPRIHHQLMPNILRVESGITHEEREGLKKKGHVLGDSGLALVGSISTKPVSPNSGPGPYYGIDAVSDGRAPGGVDGF